MKPPRFFNGTAAEWAEADKKFREIAEHAWVNFGDTPVEAMIVACWACYQKGINEDESVVPKGRAYRAIVAEFARGASWKEVKAISKEAWMLKKNIGPKVAETIRRILESRWFDA